MYVHLRMSKSIHLYVQSRMRVSLFQGCFAYNLSLQTTVSLHLISSLNQSHLQCVYCGLSSYLEVCTQTSLTSQSK